VIHAPARGRDACPADPVVKAGGLAKLAGSTAAQTRVAKFLNALGTTHRAALLAKNPMLRTLYQRLSGNFDASK
jgi:hypothetical protein